MVDHMATFTIDIGDTFTGMWLISLCAYVTLKLIFLFFKK